MKLIFSYTVVITTAMPHPVCYTNVLCIHTCVSISILNSENKIPRIRVSNVHYYYELLARGVASLPS